MVAFLVAANDVVWGYLLPEPSLEFRSLEPLPGKNGTLTLPKEQLYFVTYQGTEAGLYGLHSKLDRWTDLGEILALPSLKSLLRQRQNAKNHIIII